MQRSGGGQWQAQVCYMFQPDPFFTRPINVPRFLCAAVLVALATGGAAALRAAEPAPARPNIVYILTDG